MTAFPLLQSKLFVPPTRPALVARPRLLNRLNEGLHRRLTLISAPAGFGKTTVVSAWLAGIERPAAWLSLDEGDNDPARFLAYLVAALQTIAPSLVEGTVDMSQSPQPPSEATLTALLNGISAMPEPFTLVLDDYHVIESSAVDAALTFLLEHLPPPMHLVITTREDPPLPLARLRARGQMTELRAAELRFTPAEAAEFLDQVMGLSLSTAEVAALEERTEGWIAGLQLAALSMQGHQDVPGFIRAFTGDHRYIVDYLVEEVLQRQPTPVRDFLLQTAILDRLNGSLCDAVTCQQNGSARLDALERGNFFVVPLDDRRHWYRYHHLFAEVLLAHLRAEHPELITTLHQRASEWYGQHGSVSDAIRHALAAEDFARAADLIEMAAPTMLRHRQESVLLGWLKALPDTLIHDRPVLSAAYASALLINGEFDGIEARLRDAERWLDTSAGTRPRPHTEDSHAGAAMIVVDQEAFRQLPGALAISRAGLALAMGDVTGTVRYARQALDLIEEDDHLRRGSAEALLGLASWTSGDLQAAHDAYVQSMASLYKAGSLSDVIGCAIALADMRIAQGRLHEAMHTYEQALQLATPPGEPVLRGAADMHVGMSALYRERGDLPAATEHLLRSRELGEQLGLPQNRYRWRVAMARVEEAHGDLDSALDLLHEAERLYVGDFSPNVHPVAAVKTRVWVAQGRVGEALGWAREQGLSAGDGLSYLREFEHITLARVLLARYKSDRAEQSLVEAIGLLERLLNAAEAGARTGSMIEILALQALAHQARGDIPAALLPLERALALAEPEGYVRLFVDEGPPMSALLDEAAKRRIAPTYARQLLTAYARGDTTTPITQPLIEPLSDRELDVLRLLGSDLTGPELARELMVSVNTVRSHTKNIYSKLGVNSRRAAVRRGTELALL